MDPNLKKTLIYFGIFTGAVAVLILILNLVFKRPNHHDEARWGTVHIHLADGPEGWSQHHREQARLVLPELNRLGPTFVLGGEGPDAIRVVNVDLTTGRAGQCPDRGVARYVTNRLTGDSHIEIDPTCTHGNLEFRTALMHEIGHALGMQHVCQLGEERKDCSPVGRGLAVMNPHLTYGEDEGPGFEQAYTGPIPTFEIQALDVKEFERVARPGQRLIRPLPVPHTDAGL
jgi:hypothetical protein